MAYLSAPASDVTGDGTVYKVVYDSIVFDTCYNYNTSTGIFTASQSGNYLFYYNLDVRYIDSNHTAGQSYFILNEDSYNIYLTCVNNPWNCSNGAVNIMNASTMIPLSAGQKVQVAVDIFNGSKTIMLNGGALSGGGLSTFGGYLIS